MRLIRLARNTQRVTSLALLVVLVTPVVARTQESTTLVLDLTKPVPREQQLGAVPGMSVGGIEGQPLPRGYPLSLGIELQSISPQPIRAGETFSVELLLRNTGTSAFLLPASKNSVAVLKQGNKGRRSFGFDLIFEDPRSGRQTSSVAAVSVGSEALPDSWLRVAPGQRVRVLFRGDPGPVADWLRTDLTKLRVRARVSEWTYEDKRFFIERESQPVVSDNAISIDLAPH